MIVGARVAENALCFMKAFPGSWFRGLEGGAIYLTFPVWLERRASLCAIVAFGTTAQAVEVTAMAPPGFAEASHQGSALPASRNCRQMRSYRMSLAVQGVEQISAGLGQRRATDGRPMPSRR